MRKKRKKVVIFGSMSVIFFFSFLLYTSLWPSRNIDPQIVNKLKESGYFIQDKLRIAFTLSDDFSMQGVWKSYFYEEIFSTQFQSKLFDIQTTFEDSHNFSYLLISQLYKKGKYEDILDRFFLQLTEEVNSANNNFYQKEYLQTVDTQWIIYQIQSKKQIKWTLLAYPFNEEERKVLFIFLFPIDKKDYMNEQKSSLIGSLKWL